MQLSLATRDNFNTLLDSQVLTAQDADATAIVHVATGRDPITVTRSDFREATVRYANAMLAMGIGRNDLVIIAHKQDLESIYAFWGALRIGAMPSMFPTLTEKLDPDIYMQSMAKLVDISGVTAILTTDDFAPELEAVVSCPVYGSETLIANSNDNALEILDIAPDEIAFLQHSSGTTGLKKGVALSHEAVLNQLASYSDSLKMNADDVIVSWLPLYHDMGLIAGFLLPLIQGIPLVIMSPFDWVRHPALLFKAIEEFNGTLCWLPNFAYNHCARRIRKRDLEDVNITTMRAFINCSEPTRPESHEQFAERFAPNGIQPEQLTVSYAMAENTFAVTQTPINEVAPTIIVNHALLENEKRADIVDANHEYAMVYHSCGKPITGTQVKVINQDDGSTLDDRHVGELVVQSDCMLTEYYKRPDLEPFTDGWYLTGDMGFMLNGEVYVVGRYKDLIINAGKNVYPQDLEDIVNTIEGVHPGRCVAFGVQDEREGTELIAIIAEVDTDDKDERRKIGQTIRQTIAQRTTVTINFVHLVEAKWLIKTSSGKIARGANRDKWLATR